MKMKRLLKKEEGAGAVLFAVTLTVLLGFTALVVDYGRPALVVRQLQNAADSAALAASQELPVSAGDPAAISRVKSVAIEYAGKNGFTLAPSDVSLENETGGKLYRVSVTVRDTLDYTFARFLGKESVELERTAAVELLALGGVRNTVPIAVKKGEFDSKLAAGEYYMQLKYGSQNNEEGDFGAADLDGIAAGGANDYLWRLKYGYDDMLYIGDIILVEAGNMSGPTKTGTSFRYNSCPHSPACTASHFETGCPRVMLVPVVHSIGKKQLQVDGFAPFFLEGVSGSGNKCEVFGTYIPGIVVEGEVTGNANAYGTYGRKLVG